MADKFKEEMSGMPHAARMILRATVPVRGVQRAMFMGVVLTDWAGEEYDQRWDGNLIFVPTRREKSRAFFGESASGLMTDALTADKAWEKIEWKNSRRRGPW
jgi:hypothetical protein